MQETSQPHARAAAPSDLHGRPDVCHFMTVYAIPFSARRRVGVAVPDKSLSGQHAPNRYVFFANFVLYPIVFVRWYLVKYHTLCAHAHGTDKKCTILVSFVRNGAWTPVCNHYQLWFVRFPLLTLKWRPSRRWWLFSFLHFAVKPATGVPTVAKMRLLRILGCRGPHGKFDMRRISRGHLHDA